MASIATTHKLKSTLGSDGREIGSNYNRFSSFGPQSVGSSSEHRRRADQPGSSVSGPSGPTVVCGEDAARRR